MGNACAKAPVKKSAKKVRFAPKKETKEQKIDKMV
jgi:hypothetical protein